MLKRHIRAKLGDRVWMDYEEIYALAQEATEFMNNGNLEKALEITKKIMAGGKSATISYYVSGLLIDVGGLLGDITIVEEGKKLLEDDLDKIAASKSIAPSAYYNLANACQYLFELKACKDPTLFYFNQESDLDKAKVHFSKALKLETNKNTIAQIWVNLGNCLDTLGRGVESLECYNQSLKVKPNFGMALGNKGKAMYLYAHLCGEHTRTFILEAYALLDSAKSEITLEAGQSFSNAKSIIQRRFPKLPLGTIPQFPGYKNSGESKFERYSIKFCLKNLLYLNVCNFCQQCNASIGDTAAIKHMIVRGNSKSYLTLSSFLNEIKQDYVTARFLLIMSEYPGINLDFVDKDVLIIDTLDGVRNNVYTQHVKISYKSLYDILDKISFFINRYLGLGIKENYVNFSNMWYDDKDRKIIRKEIKSTTNISLNALYDIHKDLDYGEKRFLKDTRNALTHKFLSVKAGSDLKANVEISEGTLIKQTIELCQLVRASIIYLLQFVYIQEVRNALSSQGNRITINAHAVPNKSKKRIINK